MENQEKPEIREYSQASEKNAEISRACHCGPESPCKKDGICRCKLALRKPSLLKSIVAAGLIGLAGLVQGLSAYTNTTSNATSTRPTPTRTSGDISYFIAEKADSKCPTSYAEINHATTLPYSSKLSGFLDLYRDSKGYFAKTVVEKNLAGKLNLRAHLIHNNKPLSQEGFGASYVLPTPKGTFAKISYLPLWLDTRADKVEDKQILGIYACANLPYNLTLFTFDEVNIAGKSGAQWGYGEVELAKKLGSRFTIGANLQLNNQGEGKLTPEAIPRIAARVKW